MSETVQLIPHQDSPRCIRLNEADNVAVVVNDGGVPVGAQFEGGLVTVEAYPYGTGSTVLAAAWDSLPTGGRLVAHSVTAESDAVLLEAYRARGGDLTRVAVEAAEPIGRFTGFRPARTVTAWGVVKPGA